MPLWKKAQGQDAKPTNSAQEHRMDEQETHFQTLLQKFINGNDRSVPKHMILNVPGFPLPVDHQSKCGDGHPAAVANGKALAEIFKEAQLEWVNSKDEDVPRWVEIPVKLSGVEVYFFLWLYHQCQLRESGRLDDTPDKFVPALPDEEIGEFLSGLVRAIVVDVVMDHSTQLANGVHPLTQYRRSQL